MIDKQFKIDVIQSNFSLNILLFDDNKQLHGFPRSMNS
jgi:hypothetical protein